ncbi:hypothetical protein ACFV8T_37460 [Streptomyces sp. NPDC059832]|uniref:hypothetical protein n=1 Tax=unclassified Streptomyces TaxID=2593676 RepID=UPI003660B716
MSETTPNAKGPAPVQLPTETTDARMALEGSDENEMGTSAVRSAKGPAPVQYKPAATEPTLIPADQVNPDDIGALSLRYIDGQPQLVVSGGTVIQAGLTVVDGSGNPVGAYTAQNRVLVGFSGGTADAFTLLDLFEIRTQTASPEGIGTLAIEYRDGQPVIVVSGGTAIPAGLTVVDGAGNAVAAYLAGPASGAAQERGYGSSYMYCAGDPINRVDPHGN